MKGKKDMANSYTMKKLTVVLAVLAATFAISSAVSAETVKKVAD